MALVAASFAILLLAGACSGGDSGEGLDTTGRTAGSQESTAVSTGPETKETTSVPEATLGTALTAPGVVLRVEGDPDTTFSGICSAGGKDSVLSGRVPKRYTFDLDGQKLLCRIQKQDSGNGSLKVILTTGNTTRSVQQTSFRDGVINVSYKSN